MPVRFCPDAVLVLGQRGGADVTIKQFVRLDQAAQAAVLDGCADVVTAAALRSRARGRSWVAVSCDVGGGNGPDGVRLRAARFLKLR